MDNLKQLEKLQEETESETIKKFNSTVAFVPDPECLNVYSNEKLISSPVVDLRYLNNLNRSNINDWHFRNKDNLKEAAKVIHEIDRNELKSKATVTKTFDTSQQMQQQNSESLGKRAKLIYEKKIALDREICAMTNEIIALEEDEIKLKKSLIVLEIPKSITKECLEKRALRPETELILDDPENELTKELNLILQTEIKFANALSEIQNQKIENRNIKEVLESDWSDKSEAYEIESRISGLKNSSTWAMIQPGVTRTSNKQSLEEFWELVTNNYVNECEKCRIKSVNLRTKLTSMILCLTRDLRLQADKTEKALTCRINCTREIVRRLEIKLEECLHKLAENEKCIQNILIAIKNMDPSIKVAHTRLDCRVFRPHIESCDDHSQKGLIDEVFTIEDGVSKLLAVLKESQEVKNQTNQNRKTLERDIILKRKTIMLDSERCMQLRSRYPSTIALSGF